MAEEANQGGQQPNENAEEMDTLETEEVEFADDEKALLGEETTKKVGTLSAQKKHWRDKHNKTAADFEEYKKLHPPEKPVVEEKDKKPQKKDKDEELETLRAQGLVTNLRLDNPTLKLEDINKAVALSKAEGMETQEFINSDFFQAYLSKKAEKEAASKSAPNPSNRSGNSKSNFTGKETAEEIRAMDEATYEKYSKFLESQEGSKFGTLRMKSRISV
jgi:hypothetical protein